MRTFVQRIAAALLTLFALAAPASASGHHHPPEAFASVRIVNLPSGGTLLHVHNPGYGRTIVRSAEAIGAAAIRDVDADGDLDIIASTGSGLIFWRNLGAGRFVLAAQPAHRLHQRAGPGAAASRESTQTSGIGEQPQQLAAPGSRLATRVAPARPATLPPDTSPGPSVSRAHAGRAPPIHA